jgi:hypothetical protein
MNHRAILKERLECEKSWEKTWKLIKIGNNVGFMRVKYVSKEDNQEFIMTEFEKRGKV